MNVARLPYGTQAVLSAFVFRHVAVGQGSLRGCVCVYRYYPSKWWHATVNMDTEVIGAVGRHINGENYERVFGELKDKCKQISAHALAAKPWRGQLFS
jgi:hypothetical protein